MRRFTLPLLLAGSLVLSCCVVAGARRVVDWSVMRSERDEQDRLSLRLNQQLLQSMDKKYAGVPVEQWDANHRHQRKVVVEKIADIKARHPEWKD
jgi:Tfp pilus assembly protein PilN